MEDVAAAFVACARASVEGAHACNLRGSIMEVEEFVRAIRAAEPGAAIRSSGDPLPFACDVREDGLEAIIGPVPLTPVDVGVRRTAERFRDLHAAGRLPVGDLES